MNEATSDALRCETQSPGSSLRSTLTLLRYAAPVPPLVRILRFNPAFGGPAGPRADARAWTDALTAFSDAKATLIKQDGPVSLYRANLLGHPVAIKHSRLTSLSDRLKSAARLSRAHRQWRGAAWLAEHNIPTAPPIALLSDRSASPHSLWLITGWLDGPTLLHHLAAEPIDADHPRQRDLADALGSQIARLVHLGRFNRDHKPSNLILAPPPTSPAHSPLKLTPAWPAIAIIDSVAIRPFSPTPTAREHAAARMLASLVIEPTGIGHPPPTAWIRLIAESCAANLNSAEPADLAARILERTAALLRGHGDPTPKIHPLAAPATPSVSLTTDGEPEPRNR